MHDDTALFLEDDHPDNLGWMDDRNPLDLDELGHQSDPLAMARSAGERPNTPMAENIRP